MVNTGKIAYSASAKAAYQDEVTSLLGKLHVAQMNAPRERQAQTIANSVVEAKKQANPDMTKAEIRKAGQQALASARASVGAKRTPVVITDREWEAIQGWGHQRECTHSDTEQFGHRLHPSESNP